ncbi:hypothetical protein B0H17DRAFT_1177470 [Mycena rosella]|uniref:Uncharacterized protein n=1 Tax=Mycena rosella TaxID=1033263 RepID=A0AAD7DRG1_MYCRO|nr:hypothetical protein B0H17DRAFT_1177470 [Mycena rosella]
MPTFILREVSVEVSRTAISIESDEFTRETPNPDNLRAAETKLKNVSAAHLSISRRNAGGPFWNYNRVKRMWTPAPTESVNIKSTTLALCLLTLIPPLRANASSVGTDRGQTGVKWFDTQLQPSTIPTWRLDILMKKQEENLLLLGNFMPGLRQTVHRSGYQIQTEPGKVQTQKRIGHISLTAIPPEHMSALAVKGCDVCVPVPCGKVAQTATGPAQAIVACGSVRVGQNVNTQTLTEYSSHGDLVGLPA